MADANASLQIVVAAKDQTTNVLKGIESSIIRFVGAVSASIAAVSVALFPIKEAAEFQRELLNVGKTTEFSTTQLDKLAAGLKEMSYRLNVSAIDLAKVAAAGGQLGLGKEGVEGLLAYTEATSRFSSVLDVTVEDAGTAIGKLSNLFGVAIRDAERISSTINEISNNSTASGAELLDIIQRIGTAGGTLTLQQSAALAAYGKDLGLTSETVGTTLNKIFLDLQTKAAEVAPLVGMTVTQFADLVKTDGIAAFKLYISALERMDNVTRNTLSEQITGGGRIAAFVTAAINDAATSFSLLDRELASTNRGWTTGTSAIREQERVLSGLLAQVTILKNVFLGIAEAVGRKALPYLTELAQRAQEFGKDPEVIAWFSEFGDAIGRWVAGAVSFVEHVSSMTAVIGPLLTILRVWIALKIAETVIGWGRALVAQGQSLSVAVKGWYDLITVNREAIRTMAEAAAQARATNAELAAAGKPAKNSLTLLGLASTKTDAILAMREAQRQIQAGEASINAIMAKRDSVLGGILARMNEIKATTKQVAQQAFDDALASGATKKAATAIKRDVTAALKKEYDTLDVRGANLFVRYEDAIKKVTVANETARASAAASSASIVGGLSRVASMASAAAAAVVRYAGVLSTGLGVLFIIQYVLDLLGLLDKVTKFFRDLIGIRTEDEAAAARSAAARDKALRDERARAKELAEQYDKLAETWDKAIPNDKNTGLQSIANRLDLVQGKMNDIAFKSGEFAAGIGYANNRVATLEQQLSAAKAKLDSLQSGRASTQAWDTFKASFLPIAGDNIAADKANRQIIAAREEVDRLSTSLDLARKAQQFYTSELEKAGGSSKVLAEQERAAIERLAVAYNDEGFRMLKSLSMLVTKRKELVAAQKEEEAAKAKADAPGASDKELSAYTLTAQRVRTLEAEVSSLSAAYGNMKSQASIAALAFVRSLGVDDTTASVEKLNKAIATFGGISGESTAGLQQRLRDISSDIRDTEKELASLEQKRVDRINRLKSVLPDPTAENAVAAERAITAEYANQAAALRAKLEQQLASKANLDRELATATSLKAAYEQGGTAAANARKTSAALIAQFIDAAATNKFVAMQVEAQKKVVEAARFAAAQMKSAYESAVQGIASAVKSLGEEMRGVDSYLANRNRSLDLANFDAQTEANREARNSMNDFMLDTKASDEFLRKAGASEEMIQASNKMLRESVEWMTKVEDKMRDQQRQQLILNGLREEMNKQEQDARRYQDEAATYAGLAKDAAASGNQAGAEDYGKKAAVSSELAKEATDRLTDSVKAFKEEAARPVPTLTGATFLVSDEEIRDVTERAAKARVESAKAVAAGLEQAYRTSEAATRSQESALADMTHRAQEAQARVKEVVDLMPALAQMQGAIGEAVLKQAEGVAAMTDNLKSIASQDYRGVDALRDVATQVDSYRSVKESITEMATVAADKLVGMSDKAAALPEALRQMFAITTEQIANAAASAEKVRETLQSSLSSVAPVSSGVAFPAAAASLQDSITAGGPYKAQVEMTPTGSPTARGYASGGPVIGPGTGTSDSILSFLSHGEYVMDARTTSTFGARFFATLQRLARGSKSALTNFVSSFGGGVRIPAFASGGYVSYDMPDIASLLPTGSGNMDTVHVKFDIGGRAYDMRSDRDTVAALSRAVRNLSRSKK